MALPTSAVPSLVQFRALSFDIFGTVIDEPSNISKAIKPLVSQLPDYHDLRSSSSAQISAFDRHARSFQKANPSMSFEDVTSHAFNALAQEWNVTASDDDAKAVIHHLCSSPPFPDSIAAMKVLGSHYKLIALSNNSRAGLAEVMTGPLKELEFDVVLSAGAIGSYKPDLRNFECLLDAAKGLGVGKEQLLHVAQGVASDHGPAKQMGMWSAWISRNRPSGEKGYNEGKVTFQWRWHTLGDMARDVISAFEAESTAAKASHEMI